MVANFRARVGRVRATRVVSLAERSSIPTVKRTFKQLIENINLIAKQMGDEATPVLLEALQPTFEKSQAYTPVKTGTLKRSGYLEGRNRPDGGEVEIGYGRGGNPPYSVFVHERLDLTHAPPTRAKFLQSALEEDAAVIQRRIILGYKARTGL